jgi:hypothetical protein
VPVPVLEPGTGKTKTGRLWTYVRDDRPAGSEASSAVWFAYSPDRKGEHPVGHLKDYRGILQADGYAGFNKLYETGAIVEAACWAHVRRKFFELHQGHQSPLAREALEKIAQLYAIEKEIRGRSPDERRGIRQARSQPVLAALHAWLEATMAKLSRKSELAKAIHYALERWAALVLFVDVKMALAGRLQFCRAILTINSFTLRLTGRLPGYCRCLDPSNFRATSFRDQARMVSGLATHAI